MYNMKVISTRAWAMVKTDGLTLSAAMKLAWAEAKTSMYSMELSDDRRNAVVKTIDTLTQKVDNGTADIHDQHKLDIYRAVLKADVVNGTVLLWGKAVGLVKWACRLNGVA